MRGAANGFQFLSRNSVRWDRIAQLGPRRRGRVSIPQSEFCPLGPYRPAWPTAPRACFNSSVGILSVGTRRGPRQHHLGGCFNSSVGILSVGTRRYRNDHTLHYHSFNSSVGILSVGTRKQTRHDLVHGPGFQFLSRNSVRWDIVGSIWCISPSIWFQFLSRNSVRWDSLERGGQGGVILGFNSSVGILSVGTESIGLYNHLSNRVSIPQSEFCPLGHDARGLSVQIDGEIVSIPQSEFCPLGLRRRRCRSLRAISFNSSVGILSVGTTHHKALQRR